MTRVCFVVVCCLQCVLLSMSHAMCKIRHDLITLAAFRKQFNVLLLIIFTSYLSAKIEVSFKAKKDNSKISLQ